MSLHQDLVGQWEPIDSWKLKAPNVLSMQWRDARLGIRKIFLGHGYWHTRKDLSGVVAGSSLPKSLKRNISQKWLWLKIPCAAWGEGHGPNQGDVGSFYESQFSFWGSPFPCHIFAGQSQLCSLVLPVWHRNQGAGFISLWIWGCMLSTCLSCKEKNYWEKQIHVS